MDSLLPGAPLDQFVNAIWLLERPAAEGTAELALPTGTVELVISLDDDVIPGYPGINPAETCHFSGPLICGAYAEPFLINTASNSSTLGINFKPGGIAAFLPCATWELANRQVELSLIDRTMADEIRDEAGELGGSHLLRRIERYLVNRIKRHPHEVVAHAVDQFSSEHMPTVSDLVNDSGFSHRRFTELFRKNVGLSPKRFSRVTRFQKALARIHQLKEEPDWSGVALDCGFYDQAHLIHEFRRHANMTPTQYLSARTDRSNHPVVV